MAQATKRAARPVAGVAIFIGAWWALVRIFDIRSFFLPAPPDVVDAFSRQGLYLLQQGAVTVGHTVTGFGLAATAAIFTAIVLAAFQPVREAVLPLLVAIQAVPKVAFAPLLMMWFGFGPTSKIALVTLLCFFPVVVSTLAGLAATPAELVELSRSLSASRWQTFTKIRIPNAMPHMFTGLKVAVSLALIGAVVAQITTPNAGLGAVIVRSGQAADTSLAFAAITLLSAIGVLLYYSVVLVERLLVPWARETTA